MHVTPRPLHPSTPGEMPSLDASLLDSSSPNGIELRHANTLFNAQGQEAVGLSSPAKHYARRMTHALKTAQSELFTARDEVAEHQKLLQHRKYHRKGKRVKLTERPVRV